MTDTTYNGWTNYQTWVANLWMDNDQGSQEYWQERAQDCVQSAIDADESDIRSAAAYSLSQEMESQHDEFMPEVSGVYADLLNSALGLVNWYEIAQHCTADVDLFSAGWNMPGYMPDSDAAAFVDFESAREYIAGQIENLDDEIYPDAGIWADEIRTQKSEFSLKYADYAYWVTKL